MINRTNRKLARVREARIQGEAGFSLIELMVVIVIIGILAAIAVPVFLNQRQSAWKATVASDLKNAAIVVETWGMNHDGSFADFPVSNATNCIKATEGNTIVVSPSATTFTILGSNANVSPGSQVYDRAAGGLGKFTP
ncbi:type II secretion system protein [Glaciihabitans sp. INWT7]|uniref:type IV pilin protein n=1 Tax=Glaciihabitans sp. INWT7 TaxID=2596912 RepID=UPI00162A5F97|nr:type II secretion system protein [Glaciihabitans sp. INWT7]QNE47973.1 type II secretion system protein [Glaciihabitans sp. INWT7]